MKGLFLDDERNPADVTWIALPAIEWDIVRNFDQFKSYLVINGIPSVISFDNDLGENEPEGRECVKWMCEIILDGLLTLPNDFEFHVHSKNNVAAEAIIAYFGSFYRHISTHPK